MKVKNGDFPAMKLHFLKSKVVLDGEITAMFLFEAESTFIYRQYSSSIFCCSCAVSNLLKQRYFRSITDPKKQYEVISQVNDEMDGAFLNDFIMSDDKLRCFYPDALYLIKLRNFLSAHILPLGAYVEADWGTHKDDFFRIQVIRYLTSVTFFCGCISIKPPWDISKITAYSDEELHNLWITSYSDVIPILAEDALKRTESIFATFYNSSALAQALIGDLKVSERLDDLENQLGLQKIDLEKIPKREKISKKKSNSK